MTAVVEEKEAYRQSFERFVGASVAEPDWQRERRAAAFARFVEKGLPGPRDEAWRQTPIAPITRTLWEPVEPPAAVPDDVAPPLSGSGQVVLVDGRYSPELSSLDPDDPAVEVHSLRELLGSRPERLEPLLGEVQGVHASVFADLNAAFAADGVVVFLTPGTILEEPLHLAHVATGTGSAPVSYSRVLVVAGRGSEGRILETFAGPEGPAYLVNAVTEVAVEDNAFVDHYKLQQEGEQGFHVATLAARLGRDARFADHSFTFGAAISRNDIDVRFAAEGGECVLDGLFLVDGTRLADTHSRVDHARPHCSSRELYKGVLSERARGVFNGLVLVRPGAQRTDAEQMNRNLLLSPEALVHSVPQLEILADDVKCRHGSTTGQLDPRALFYLRSRGIGEDEARGLLTWAFASDLVHDLPVPSLRRAVQRHLQTRLKGAALVEEAIA
ncbi:MAG: Fe-S cluster assembly protein SufD [Acidobacteria bacterium]|nr:Fe-S cluster assembly protein SufD [Acidobacteriota bacterium]